MRPRVLRHVVGRVGDPAAVFAALYGTAANAFWLDGGTAGTHYLGTGDPVPLARGSVLDGLRRELGRDAPLADAAAPAFRLGLVGWLEYELRGETLGLGVPGDRVPARFLRVDRLIAVDAATGAAELLALGEAWSGELLEWRERATEAMAAAPSPTPPASPDDPGIPLWRADDDAYRDHIAACRAAIADGDAYQLCLTTRAFLPGARPDALELYRRLRTRSATHHGGIVRIGDTTLVSASPERFVALGRDRRISTSPVKGTRRRSADPEEDARLAAELLGSEKERAENLMIVDLMRNDLARICDVGTVEVTRLLEVERYAQVHQLVSTIEGRLRDGLSVVDAIAACFPAGSMTGAPKRRATELLAALEGAPREVYSGAFGWIGLDGAADLAMVIRSVVLDPRGASVGAGGGITALSVPEEEVAEMHLKAAPLLAALGVRPAP